MSDPYARFPKAGSLRPRALKLAAQGLNGKAIAQKLGTSESTVSIALDPQKAERYAAAYLAKRKTYERTGHRAHKERVRQGKYGRCPECGRGVAGSTTTTCQPCKSTKALTQAQAITDMWLDGATYPQITKRLGVHKSTISVTLSVLRAAGHQIPRRGPSGRPTSEPHPGHRITIQPGDLTKTRRKNPDRPGR